MHISGGRRPSVSAVIPTRDRPELLRRAVQAVLEQEYDGIVEVVVVYDQSEPSEVDVATSEHRRVVVLRNERTPGLAGARNTGVLAASGELVAFCDDDDEWLPGKLDKQVAALEAAPSAALVACGILVNFEGKDRERPAPATPVARVDFLRDRVMEVNPCTALLYRSMMIDTIGLVDEAIPGSYAEDYEWLLRATDHGVVVCVPEPYVRVNWHKASFFADRWRTILAALGYLLERHPDFAQQPRGLARIQGQMAFAEAALGHRRHAVVTAAKAFRNHPLERRVPVALLVALGAVRADTVVGWAHARGRGI